MAFERSLRLPAAPVGTCRWCRASVPKGRRTRWCSQECVESYLIRASPGRVRALVFERDRGVCAKCRLNTERLSHQIRDEYRRINRYRISIGLGYEMPHDLDERGVPKGYGVLIEGRRWYIDGFRTLWEADHIVPVIEGGGLCGLDGYRTLCLWCHRRATAELARRRAELARRRAEWRSGQESLTL